MDEKKPYKRPTDEERLQKLEMQIAASEAELKKQKARAVDLKAEMKKKQDLRQSKAIAKLGKEVFEVLVSHKYPINNLRDPNDIVARGKAIAELGETMSEALSSIDFPIDSTDSLEWLVHAVSAARYLEELGIDIASLDSKESLKAAFVDEETLRTSKVGKTLEDALRRNDGVDRTVRTEEEFAALSKYYEQYAGAISRAIKKPF